MIRTTLLLLLLLAPALRADADADYQALLDAHRNRRYADALERSEAFVRDHAAHKYAGAAYYIGGNSGLNAGEYDRAEALYKAMLEKHADNRHIGKARNELVTVYDSARKLDACIVQCEANIKADADSEYIDRWHYMIGQSRYRLWDFRQSEKDLKSFKVNYPESQYINWADYYVERINPPLKLDANGVVQGYDGKYVEDARFVNAMKRLPAEVKDAWKILKRTLGVDLKDARVVFQFEDKGFRRDTNRATTETISVKYEPFTRMIFYTEHIVLSAEDHRSRIVHELKHAAFRDVMGQGYLDLPRWVREGLAVYGAEQFEDRLAAIIGGEVFSGKDPRRVLDGIDDADHDTSDYLEDAAAFLWLESRKKGGVHEFCKRLLKGEDYRKLFAEIGGMEYSKALDAAGEYARRIVEDRLGDAEESYLEIRDNEFAQRRKQGHIDWYRETGIKRYRDWLEVNPDHPFAANCRYRLAKGLILIGEHEEGRKFMQAVTELDQVRSSICDDAQHWLATSFETEKNTDGAKVAWGVLLRDYSWSRQAIDNKDKHTAAGPVKFE
ncbi:MAG: hypothetical protein K8I27_12305 [Planctomycetes bacterium]|nr:hypothetical protein [Planctomycetota bacterium]